MEVSGNLGWKVPVVDDIMSSHEQRILPTNSLDENSIEFAYQTDWNSYVDLRVKIVKGRSYETYSSKEIRKGAKRMRKQKRSKRLQFLSLLM